MLYELAQRPATGVPDLRAEFGLDSGYLSRLLARLERQGLVRRRRSDVDARRQVVELTPAGEATVEELDARAAAETRDLLDQIPAADRNRLVGAMGTVREVLGDASAGGAVALRPMGIGDYGWVISRHGALYSEEYGWDERMESLVARIVADFVDVRDQRREAAWIAELDGRRAGCVFCVREDDDTAKLRLLLVEPDARGHGIGAALVDECLRFARGAGYSRMRLWTQSILTSAHRIYEARGFDLVEEEPHHSFGVDLVAQTWELKLDARPEVEPRPQHARPDAERR